MAGNDSTAPSTVGLFARIWTKICEYNRNIWGSDATVAYSAEYAWLSNQMSHVMMGFFAASVWALILRHGQDQVATAWFSDFAQSSWGVWLILIVPFVKDAIDYGLDVWWRPGKFAVNKAELRLDWITDEFFWLFGMVLAIALFGRGIEHRGYWIVGTLLAGGVGTYYLVSRVWVPQKRMFDASRMPFNFVRLIKYSEPEKLFSDVAMKTLADFQGFAGERTPSQQGRHYILVGGRPVQRSQLAVSMGCEYISFWKGVYMISAVKIMEDPARMSAECQMPPELKTQIHCLIIDDLNVSLPIPSSNPVEREHARITYEMQQSAAMMDAESGVPAAAAMAEKVINLVNTFAELRTKFPHVTTIWVLSARKTTHDQSRLLAWRAFIEELVTGQKPTESLITITLNEIADP